MFKQIFMFLIILGIVVAGRYYYYIEYEDTGSEVGRALHENMPSQVREWGCRRLNERFPGEAHSGCIS